MILTDAIGLTGLAFAFASIAIQLLGIQRTWPQQFLLLVGLMFCALWPIGEYLSLAAYLRGHFGDLSTVSLLLLTIMFGQKRKQYTIKRHHLLWLVSLTALIFYPFALGLSAFDPYRLGFDNLYFVAGLFVLSLVFWYIKENVIVLAISLAVCAWAIGLAESTNLWDYLLDPWLAIYAFFSVFKSLKFKKPT